MADAEAKKIELWADGGDRADPEDVGIDRSVGWPVSYEQVGGNNPSREIWNQIFRELSGWSLDRLRMGVPRWDSDVNYIHPAFVTAGDDLYVSLESNGPDTGNATNPTTAGQTIWRIY